MSKTIIFPIFELIIMLTGMGYLLETDAYYLPYLIVGTFAIYCMFSTKEITAKWHNYLSPVVYSLAITYANYGIWSNIEYPDEIGVSVRFIHSASVFLSIFLCGYFQAYHILKWIRSHFENDAFRIKEKTTPFKPWQVFLVPFVMITLIDTTVLFLCRYPGNVSSDSLTQIKMFLEGWYNNHHPFFHTQVIRIFVTIGLNIFGDLNAAIALYNVFQILFMAACFSAAVMTLYEMKAHKCIYIALGLFYALMPFHINYSFSVWKDVMFGGIVLLFAVYLLRTIGKIGSKIPNYIFLALSSLGVCLFRSNGYIMFFVVVLVYAILYRKEILTKDFSPSKISALIFLGALIVSFLLKHPFLAAMDVSQPDTVEKLSIPLQQITRVAVDDGNLSEEDINIIENVVSLDRMKEVYHPNYSDPVKDLIRHEGNQNYIKENIPQFISLYTRLAFTHPGSYIKAWVDQTCGYWNSGYDYWRWLDDTTSEEGYDIYRTVNSEFFARHFNEYLWIFENNPLLIIFMCIGFYVWIDWVLLYLSAVRKDRLGVVMAMPIIALVFTLQISSPVYSEFRYVYSVFCAVPFLIPALICRQNKDVLQ